MAKAVPLLQESGNGSIILTSSMSGIVGSPFSPLYSLTKGALVTFGKSVALALAHEHVRHWVPQTRDLLIGGAPVAPAGDEWDVLNPATEEVIGRVGAASPRRPRDSRARGVPLWVAEPFGLRAHKKFLIRTSQRSTLCDLHSRVASE